MLELYKIKNTEFLNPNELYSDPNIYPNFQLNFEIFKEELKNFSINKNGRSYFKFGDGDYSVLNNKPHGTAKPGVRDIKKNYFKKLDLEKVIEYSKKSDFYCCEIINFNLFEETFGKKSNYPAEYIYGIIANKWIFSNFNKIGLIGADKKINLINELIAFPQYQQYLGKECFESLISIPQSGALTNAEKIFKKIKNQINNEVDIYLIGVGHAQTILLPLLKEIIDVPIVSIGTGMDAIAGLIDINRPYFGNWKNFRVSNESLYKGIIDPYNFTTNDPSSVVYLN
tara:strand:+ start:2005 stop:2856 length:852 start_codon:yes stop_codon:yes gene_type:complete